MEKKDIVHITTLGCSKNVVDSEELLGRLQFNDIETTEEFNKANVLIINTCGFIKPAKQESMDVIFSAVELKKQHKIRKIFVIGCLAQRYTEQLRSQIPDVDFFFGINSYEQVINSLNPQKKYIPDYNRTLLTPPHFAYLKISEGCSHKCSFCAIPIIRGNHVSKPMETVLDEAKKLVEQGVKEINIIAQDTTYYGTDLYDSKKLPELMDKISDIKGVEWLRLLYTYPTNFPIELIDVISQKQNICKYLDIPLQHISTKILKAMKRGMDEKKTRELIETIRTKAPEIALRTTFIVGYPNESEADFLLLQDFIKTTEFERVGIFEYSEEDGTAAAFEKDNVKLTKKENRRDSLMTLQQKISLQKNMKLISKEMVIIIDERTKTKYIGRTEFDAPDVDNGVLIKRDAYRKHEHKPGDFVKAVIEDATEYDLIAKFIN